MADQDGLGTDDVSDEVASITPLRRPALREVATLPADNEVVAMIEFSKTVWVATRKGIYYLRDGKMIPLEFMGTING